MTHLQLPFTPRRLSVCIALAFPLASGGALAQSTFEASGAYSIGIDKSWTGVQPKSGRFSLPETAVAANGGAYGGPAGRLDSSAYVSATSLGSGYFGGVASTSAFYAAQAPMSTNTTLVYRDQISNTGSVAQEASFALDISSLRFAFDYGTRYGVNKTSFAAKVYVDGASAPVWSSTFSYDDGSTDYGYGHAGTVMSSGVNLGLAAALPSSCSLNYGGFTPTDCSFGSGGFGISGYHTTIDLGPVAAGQSLGIRYEVDLKTETDMYGGDASVYFNDPSLLSANGPAAGRLAFDTVTDAPANGGGVIAAVPEPETYALMAAGLGLLAVARRRRNR